MIAKVFSISICITSFLYTSYVLRELMYFLSDHNQKLRTSVLHKTNANWLSTILWNLMWDMALLSMFMVQHTIMASDTIKNIFDKLRISNTERCIYNITSAAVLHFLCINWHFIPWCALWNVDTTQSEKLWLFFTIFHIFGWSIIYGGCLMMDISELAGIKQVYYDLSDRPNPMTLKSRELRRYYEHMRHPSFFGFCMIFWIHPFMTVDRFLLAVILTLYMSLSWNIDDRDYDYHKHVFRWKLREL